MLRRLNSLVTIIFLLGCHLSFEGQLIGGVDDDLGAAIAQVDGRIFITGTTRSFGFGSEALWVVDLDENLNYRSHRTWGGVNQEIAGDIAGSCDGGYVIAGSTWDDLERRSTVVLIGYNKVGDILWTSYFGGEHEDIVSSITRTQECGYLITGTNRAEGHLGAGFVIKTTDSGELIWERHFDNLNRDVAVDVLELEDSSLLILLNTRSFLGKVADSADYQDEERSGLMLVKCDSEGNELWRSDFSSEGFDFASKMISDDIGGCYVVGSSMHETNGSFDMTLYHLSDTGELLFRKNFGGADYEYGADVLKVENRLFMIGSTLSFSENEFSDIYYLAVDLDGELIWQTTFGGTYADEGIDLIKLQDGSIGLLGNSTTDSGIDQDLFFIKLNLDGKQVDQVQGDIRSNTSEPILFPNPATDQLRVFLGDINPIINARIDIYDQVGRLVISHSLQKKLTEIPFEDLLASGTYFYRIELSDASYSGKVIINR